MTATATTPTTHIQMLLSICFEGGERRCRELRLNEADAQYIEDNYHAAVRPMGDGWYEITFLEVS